MANEISKISLFDKETEKQVTYDIADATAREAIAGLGGNVGGNVQYAERAGHVNYLCGTPQFPTASGIINALVDIPSGDFLVVVLYKDNSNGSAIYKTATFIIPIEYRGVMTSVNSSNGDIVATYNTYGWWEIKANKTNCEIIKCHTQELS